MRTYAGRPVARPEAANTVGASAIGTYEACMLAGLAAKWRWRQILQRAENRYLADQQKDMPKVDARLLFVIDEKNNQVDLTDLGVDMITEAGEDKSFFIIPDVGAVLADLKEQIFRLKKKWLVKINCWLTLQ